MDKKNVDIYDMLENLDLSELYNDSKKDSLRSGNNGQYVNVTAEDCIYDKTYICPVCGSEVKSKAVRRGKIKFVSNEIDLKPKFEPIQPDFYDIVICNNCGYSAMTSKFSKITYSQEEAITKNITPKFHPKKYPKIYTIDDAIERYKLALLNCVYKNSKAGEKAYLCLKLAWFYRDKNDEKNEQIYLKAAYQGFNKAYINEVCPICGLDENTLLYIIAAIGMKIGCIDEARKILSGLITRKNLGIRLKNKIEDLREILKQKKSEENVD